MAFIGKGGHECHSEIVRGEEKNLINYLVSKRSQHTIKIVRRITG